MKQEYETSSKISENSKVQKAAAPQSNQAALTRLMTCKSCDDVKQFKVGMEYQTFGGIWNIKKLKTRVDRAAAESSEANLLNNLCSAKRGFNRNRGSYNMTSDGSDFEYITKAYDETTQKDALVQSAAAAGANHRAVSNMTDDLLFGKYFHLKSGGTDYYVNKGGEISAHPQATIGVRCESIEALFQKLANEPGEYLADSAPTKETDIGKKKIVEAVDSTALPSAFSPTAKGFLLLAEENIHGAALKETMHFEDLLEQVNDLENDWNTQLDALIIPPFPAAESELSVTDVEQCFRLLAETIGTILPNSARWTGFAHNTSAEITASREEESPDTLKGMLVKIAGDEEQIRTWFNEILIAGKVEELVLSQVRPDLSKQLLEERLDHLSSMVGAAPSFSAINREAEFLKIELNQYQKPHDAFKYTLPVKERTSLKDLFCLLSPEERARVKTYLGNYPPNVLIVREKNAVVKLSDFLASLPDTSDGTDVVDLIKQEAWSVGELDNAALGSDHPDNHGTDYFEEFGITRSTDIGQDKAADPAAGTPAEVVHGVIVELRDMKRHLQPEEWGDAAAAVADAVQILNQRPPL